QFNLAIGQAALAKETGDFLLAIEAPADPDACPDKNGENKGYSCVKVKHKFFYTGTSNDGVSKADMDRGNGEGYIKVGLCNGEQFTIVEAVHFPPDDVIPYNRGGINVVSTHPLVPSGSNPRHPPIPIDYPLTPAQESSVTIEFFKLIDSLTGADEGTEYNLVFENVCFVELDFEAKTTCSLEDSDEDPKEGKIHLTCTVAAPCAPAEFQTDNGGDSIGGAGGGAGVPGGNGGGSIGGAGGEGDGTPPGTGKGSGKRLSQPAPISEKALGLPEMTLGLPYPNPASQVVTIPVHGGAEIGVASVILRDVTGRVVSQTNYKGSGVFNKELAVDVSSLPVGYYLCEVTVNNTWKKTAKVSVTH
ncbi:MAG TPA: T9SS type A sorting domain-containing protein, partial [Flavobacteriales bacterium]|nr:T9SS type A sorting domain-containing protein [Flavobacteriales bacterium]